MSTTAAQTDVFQDLDSHEGSPIETDDTHDLIRSMIAAEAEEALVADEQSEPEPREVADELTHDEDEDLDLIRSMIEDEVDEEEEEEDEVVEFEDADPSLEADPEFLESEDTVEDSSVAFDEATLDEGEPEQRLSWAARRRQKAEAKAAAKAERLAEKQAKIDAKAEEKAARAAAKQAKIDAVAEAKAAREAAKQAKIDAKAAAKAKRAAAKQAKLDAAAEAKATRAAAKQAKDDAAAEAKAARAAAIQDKADAKAEAKAARIARKQADATAAAELKAARDAAKQAKADAKKAEAKAAKVAAKLASKEAKSPSISDKATEEIQKSVLKAVALEETGTTATPVAVMPENKARDSAATPDVPVRKKPVRPPGKPMRQRVAEFRAAMVKVYARLPERPTRQQFLRATAVFVLLVEPWLVPIVSLITVVSLTFAYFAMGPDRAAEITGAGYRWLKKREPEKAEKVRRTAEKFSEKMSGWISRLPDRWSRGLYVPDFSKDDGKSDKVLEDRFDRLARESRSL